MYNYSLIELSPTNAKLIEFEWKKEFKNELKILPEGTFYTEHKETLSPQ